MTILIALGKALAVRSFAVYLAHNPQRCARRLRKLAEEAM